MRGVERGESRGTGEREREKERESERKRGGRGEGDTDRLRKRELSNHRAIPRCPLQCKTKVREEEDKAVEQYAALLETFYDAFLCVCKPNKQK